MVSVEILSIANWIFTIGSILFALALVPTVLYKHSAVPWKTSALTAVVLWVYVGVYVAIGFSTAQFAGAATALLWTVILVFRRPRTYLKPIYETSTGERL